MGQSRPGGEDSGELYAGIVFPLGVKEPALRGRGAGLLLFAGDAPLSGSDKTATNSGREFEYGALAPLTAVVPYRCVPPKVSGILANSPGARTRTSVKPTETANETTSSGKTARY